MIATVSARQGEFGIEISDNSETVVPWVNLDTLDQEGTLNDYLLVQGVAPAGSWSVQNKISSVQLRWAPSPAVLLGVVAPIPDTEVTEFIE